MKLEWALTAQSYLDQLSQEERAKVVHAIEKATDSWDGHPSPQLYRLAGNDGAFSLRAGADLRVILSRHEDRITVDDVIRRSQVDGLRRLRTASG